MKIMSLVLALVIKTKSLLVRPWILKLVLVDIRSYTLDREDMTILAYSSAKLIPCHRLSVIFEEVIVVVDAVAGSADAEVSSGRRSLSTAALMLFVTGRFSTGTRLASVFSSAHVLSSEPLSARVHVDSPSSL